MLTTFFRKCRFYGPDYFGTRSYSQLGEDLLVKAFIGDKWRWDYSGFYVDIGAHDPKYLSNTKKFYDVGWHGINVDASTEAIKKFNHVRRRDINVHSEREAGHGRADIIFTPRLDYEEHDKLPGIIMELKHIKAEETEKDSPPKKQRQCYKARPKKH